MAYLEADELLLVGGVGANRRLQEMLDTMCRERDAKFYCPPSSLMGDNGAMIAYLGLLMYRNGHSTKIEESTVKPDFRVEDVDVNWD
jgi:N6-L-threonylcarbamoyladenine synthase